MTLQVSYSVSYGKRFIEEFRSYKDTSSGDKPTTINGQGEVTIGPVT